MVFGGMMLAGSGSPPVYLAAAGHNTTSSSSITQSHTIAAGTTMVVAFVEARDNNPLSISSITYGGVAMVTLRSPVAFTASVSPDRCSIFAYYLANPTSGSQNLSVTFSESVTSARSEIIDIKDVNLGNPLLQSNTDTKTPDSFTEMSLAITPTSPSLLLWAFASPTSGGTPSQSGDATTIDEGITGGTDTSYWHAYLRDVTGGVSKSQTAILGVNRSFGGMVVSLDGA